MIEIDPREIISEIASEVKKILKKWEGDYPNYTFSLKSKTADFIVRYTLKILDGRRKIYEIMIYSLYSRTLEVIRLNYDVFCPGHEVRSFISNEKSIRDKRAIDILLLDLEMKLMDTFRKDKILKSAEFSFRDILKKK